ncbi:MAG: hypothetical protein JSS35_15120 [Proteobacteria bacterium]|nr:hypothetical protein [Pseudomonadota bacterium]
MRRLVLSAVVLAALAMGSAADAQPAGKDPCILTRLLQGHTVGGDGHTLYLGVNGTEVYKVTTSGSCLAHATNSDPILIRDHGLGKICRPLDLEIFSRGTQCGVDSLTKLTPEQASALPKRLQP